MKAFKKFQSRNFDHIQITYLLTINFHLNNFQLYHHYNHCKLQRTIQCRSRRFYQSHVCNKRQIVGSHEIFHPLKAQKGIFFNLSYKAIVYHLSCVHMTILVWMEWKSHFPYKLHLSHPLKIRPQTERLSAWVQMPSGNFFFSVKVHWKMRSIKNFFVQSILIYDYWVRINVIFRSCARKSTFVVYSSTLLFLQISPVSNSSFTAASTSFYFLSNCRRKKNSFW